MSSDEYYTPDLSLLPYSEIFRGRDGRWSYFLRFIVLLRKMIGWHFEALNGRAFPCQGKQVDLDNLPLSLRDGISGFIQEANELGFQAVCIVKEDTIGYYASYRCLLVSPDRRTTISLGAIRLATVYNSVVGLRSDTVHKKVLLTTRESLPTDNLVNRENYQIENLDEAASISKLLEHHNRRLSGFSSDQIVKLPNDDMLRVLRNRTNDDLRIFIGKGLLRKLTKREVEKLQLVQFDFE